MTKPCPCGRLDAKKQALSVLRLAAVRTLKVSWPHLTRRALMRSRYSAFVLEKAGYLLSTWHASQRPATLDFEPERQMAGFASSKPHGD